MKNAIKTLLFISTATVLVIFNGCKKEEHTFSTPESNVLKKGLLEKAEKNGKQFVFPIHQKVKAYFADVNGNKVDFNNLGSKGTYLCDYSNTPTATLLDYARTAICGYTDNELRFKYEISSNNAIVQANPSNATNNNLKSRGQIRVYNGATLIYSQTTYNSEIVHIGTDPNDPDYELYEIAFISQPIPVSYLIGSYTIKIGQIWSLTAQMCKRFHLQLQIIVYQIPASLIFAIKLTSAGLTPETAC